MIRCLVMLAALLPWLLFAPLAALAQLDPQNMPAPTLPLTGSEIIPCDQSGGYKKCLFSNFIPSGNANLIYATPNGASGAASLRAMVDPDIPLTGVTPGSYTCTNLTVIGTGRLTVATNGTCNGASLNLPGYSCTNTGGVITCTQPCDAWPIVVCSNTLLAGAPAIPILLAAKPALGDVLLAITNNSAAAFGAGWTAVAACNPGSGIIPGAAWHVVGPGDGQVYSPSASNGGVAMVQGIVDVTALGAAGGSWANAFNSQSCVQGTGALTVSGTTPATGAVQLAIGQINASSGSITNPSLTGIATDPQYGSAINSSAPSAMGIAYAIGAGSGSAYSLTWNFSGGGIGNNSYAAVLFFNAGPTFAVPTCTVSSGTCSMTSQSGPAAMYMTLSGASAATTLTLANLPAVTNAYACQLLGDKTTSTIWGIQTGWSTTGATFTFYTKGTATAASPGAADVETTSCWGT